MKEIQDTNKENIEKIQANFTLQPQNPNQTSTMPTHSPGNINPPQSDRNSNQAKGLYNKQGQKGILSFGQCPVSNQSRGCTDLFCVLVGLAFFCAMLVIAILNNNANVFKGYRDSDGNQCGSNQSTTNQSPNKDLSNYRLLYYTSLDFQNAQSNRLCVQSCPYAQAYSISKFFYCYPTSNLSCEVQNTPGREVQVYDSQQNLNQYPGVCIPKDKTYDNVSDQEKKYYKEKRQKLFNILNIKYPFNQPNIKIPIYFACLFSFVFSLIPLLLSLVSLNALRKCIHWSFIFGSLCMITAAVAVIIKMNERLPLKIIISVFLIINVLLILKSLFDQNVNKNIFISARLHQVASLIIWENYWLFLYAFVWMGLTYGFIRLMLFQLQSVIPKTVQTNLGILNIFDLTLQSLNGWKNCTYIFFVVIQFLWGISFLKESYNFFISGFATMWYCHRNAQIRNIRMSKVISRFFFKHLGSVIGGSLLICMFYYIDLIIDSFCSTYNKYRTKEDIEEQQQRYRAYNRNRNQSQNQNQIPNTNSDNKKQNIKSKPQINENRQILKNDRKVNKNIKNGEIRQQDNIQIPVKFSQQPSQIQIKQLKKKSTFYHLRNEQFKVLRLKRKCCQGFLDLIRTQSFAYINLIPTSYCQASRFCEMLSENSIFFNYSKIINRLYNICAHFPNIFLACLFAFLIKYDHYKEYEIFAVINVAFFAYFFSTYLISLQSNLIQGVFVSIILQEYLFFLKKSEKQKNKLQIIAAPPFIVKDIYVDVRADVYGIINMQQFIIANIKKRPHHTTTGIRGAEGLLQ